MKNLLFVILCFSVTTVCAQKNNIEKDIKMYEQLWDDIVNKGQIDLINAKHFDTNVTIALEPENVVGVDAFKAYYQNFLTGFSDIKFTVIHVFGQDNNIVKHWRFEGNHTGAFFGIPASGRSVDIEGVTIAKMKNGKISREQDFMDNAVFFSQLGLSSDPNNLTVIDNIYKAFAVGDIPIVIASLDTSVVWNEAEGNSLADGNPYMGPDAVLNGVFARLGDKYETFALANIELHEMSNNQVLATLRYKGTAKLTGKIIDAQAAHHWTLNNGKVTAFQQYVDTKQLAESEKK
jgi:steroid delta-isomerase-like uncharacterized protein